MAQEKKDGKDGKDSDYEFIPPDFDEDAFIHREMVSFRTTAILFVWGILAAVATWGAFSAMDGSRGAWFLGLAIAAAFGVALKWVFPLLKTDIKHFGRREWLGTGALFFFTWLAFFLIAVNPPVSDFAAPRVDLYASPVAQSPEGEVSFHLFVEDNVAVDEHSFRLAQGAEVLATEGNLTSLGHGHYVFTASGLAPGTYRLEGTARDGEGHEGEGSLDFAVSEALIDYSATGGGTLTGDADRVLVRTAEGLPACKTSKGTVTTRDPCVRTVRLEMVGATANITLEYSKDEEAWIGTTALAGWTPGNNTFDVVAELADRYSGSTRFDGGEVRDGPHTVQVTDGTLGSTLVTPPRDPSAHQRNVPGLGLPILAAGLLAAVLVLRRRA